MDQRELNSDTQEALRLALYSHNVNTYTSMPAFVTEVSADGSRVQVQPVIQEEYQQQDGTYKLTTLKPLVDVMVLRPASGGLAITLPIAYGDECLLFFANRCIDNWADKGGIQMQAETRLHSISDGFAFFGPQSTPNVIPAVSTTSLQIRTKLGTTYIEITQEGAINIVSPELPVTITGNLVVTGSVVAAGGVS